MRRRDTADPAAPAIRNTGQEIIRFAHTRDVPVRNISGEPLLDWCLDQLERGALPEQLLIVCADPRRVRTLRAALVLLFGADADRILVAPVQAFATSAGRALEAAEANATLQIALDITGSVQADDWPTIVALARRADHLERPYATTSTPTDVTDRAPWESAPGELAPVLREELVAAAGVDLADTVLVAAELAALAEGAAPADADAVAVELAALADGATLADTPPEGVAEETPTVALPAADAAEPTWATTPEPFTTRRSASPTAAPSGRRLIRMLAVAAAVLLTLGAIGGASAWWYANNLAHQLSAGDKAAVVADAREALAADGSGALAMSTTPVIDLPTDDTTILLIGSDTRGARSTSGGNSDTIMLLRYSPSNNAISTLAIPRDFRVDIPGQGIGKINWSFAAGGPKLLIQTLRESLGVKVNHFAVVDFAGFRTVVNRLDGAWIPIDQRYYNNNDGSSSTNYSDINLHIGYQRLTGPQALSFVRYRHTDTDMHRSARQQLFLREMRRVTLAPANLLAAPDLLQIGASAVTSDVDNLGDLTSLVQGLMSVPSERVHRFVLEDGTGGIDPESGQWYFDATNEQREAAVRRWLNAVSDDPPASSTPSITATTTSASAKPSRAQKLPGKRANVEADDGTLRDLVLQTRPRGMRVCAPTVQVVGWYAPSDEAARSYRIEREPALALVGEGGPGTHWLLMQTTWQDPPILSSPSESRQIAGRTYDLWWEGKALRQIAWRDGPTRAWLTNSLRNDLSNRTMLALAKSCRPVF